jgi:hypothetical protein
MRLPAEADDLPDSLAYWRNNVSINGDGWGWQDADGNWHQCRSEPTPDGITPVPYTSLSYGGDAYYAPGHSPRSWYARWIWLAWRNVATKRMLDVGPLVTQQPVLLADVQTETSRQRLYWNGVANDGAAYQWHSTQKWGPFKLWTNVGAKLEVCFDYPEVMPTRAVVTGTWRAARLWS